MKKNSLMIENKGKKTIQLLFVFLLVAIAPARMTAQSQYDVIVNSTFSPTISDAQQKINEKARIVDTVKVSKPVDYNIISPVYTSRFSPEPIKAPKVGKDQISRLYRNFVKVGFGNYWTPYLDFELNSLRSTKGAYGGRVFHNSSWGKIKSYAPASYSDTKAEVYAQKFFKNYTLNGTAGYDHLLAHCYGFQPDSIFPQFIEYKLKANDIRRQYHHIYADVNFSNNDIQRATLNQFYDVRYDFLSDNTPQTYEHQLTMRAALDHDIALKKSFSLNVGGEVGFGYFHDRWGGAYLSDNAIANVNPHVTFKYEEYFIKIGFDALLHFRHLESARFHLYPDIEVRLHIVPEIFTFYAGLDGGMKRNSYLSFAQENPYLSENIYLGFTDEKAKIFAGIQLGISRSLSLGAKASFGFYSGKPFFYNDLSLHWLQNQDTGIVIVSYNTFGIEYDKSNQFNAHFDLRYQYKNDLWLTLNLDYNYYKLSMALIAPWYKPAFVAEFDIEYLLLRKFLFGLDFYVQTGAKYPQHAAPTLYQTAIIEGIPMAIPEIPRTVVPVTMKAVFDFNFSFEYLWSKRLSFFAHINNFTCQRNYFYQDYPSQRINFLVGAKYNFGGEAIGKK
jgi:hypothetical protein